MWRGGLTLLILCACSFNPPLEEYSLAKAAIDAAKQYESDRFSPGIWYQAEENYRKGQVAFKASDFEDAKQFFIKARVFAEKSEDKARSEKGKIK
jgi:hypothetical protein